MTGDGRLQLDDHGDVVEAVPLPAMVVELERPEHTSAGPRDAPPSRRRVSRAVAAILCLLAVVTGLRSASPRTPGTSPGSPTVFRDPGTGAVVIAYTPQRPVADKIRTSWAQGTGLR